MKLNGTLPNGGDVLNFVISPSGSRVLYNADQSADGLRELWSVPTNRSSPPVRISGTLVTGGDVNAGFRVSPDGTRAFYLADQDIDGVVELYSAPVAGGSPPVKLNTPLPAGRDVLDFRVSPDSQRVVYRADQGADERFDLYTVPALGGTAVKLNGPLVAGGDVLADYEIDPLSTRVAYLADKLTDVMVEVFSAPIDGSAPSIRLNPPLIAQGDVWSLGIAPGGQRLAYLADAEVDGTVELYSVGLDGSGPVKLNAALPPGGNVGKADGVPFSVLFSGDGTRAVYWADQEVDEVTELYSVPMSGAAPPLELSGPLAAGGDVSSSDLRVSADGLHVLFRADKTADETFELWSAPLDGSAAPVRLNDTLPGSGDVLAYGLGNDPTDQRVAFLGDAELDEQIALWSAPIAGGTAPLQLNGPLLLPPILGDVGEYSWAPDGERVLYGADQEGDGYGLFSKRTGSFAPAQMLSSPAGRIVSHLLFPPGSQRVAFRSYGFSNDPFNPTYSDDDIFSAPRGGGQAPVLIGDSSDDGTVLNWIALNSGRLIYSQGQAITPGPPPSWHIWNAAIDGSQPPFELTVASGARILQTKVTPQQDLALYSALESGVYSLRAVPVDGSTPPVVITPPLAGLGSPCTPRFQVTPAGDRAIFVSAFATGDPDELWSVPVTGGAPERLSAALLPDRDVDPSFQLTPDGARVVYRADQDSDEVYELYSAPTLGGSIVKLNGAMAAGGDVAVHGCEARFVLSPDGARVIYLADQASDEVYELFSAPVDGSSPSVRLDPSLSDPFYPDIYDVSFTPDGERVVYVARRNASAPRALFSAPADGSGPAIELTPPMVANGGVKSFGHPVIALTPDGASVVYLADQSVYQTYELFSVPLDGSRVSTRLNGQLVAGGNVVDFKLGPTGDALYRADEEHDGAVELFLTLVPHAHAPARRSGPP